AKVAYYNNVISDMFENEDVTTWGIDPSGDVSERAARTLDFINNKLSNYFDIKDIPIPEGDASGCIWVYLKDGSRLSVYQNSSGPLYIRYHNPTESVAHIDIYKEIWNDGRIRTLNLDH
ncbi:hypothetical protein IJ732_05180, partial [bacterium]|nr:hypothetical protein [bacterium]